ncbi:MAG: leucyl aminopeptidase [Pseudomonadota bacterium]
MKITFKGYKDEDVYSKGAGAVVVPVFEGKVFPGYTPPPMLQFFTQMLEREENFKGKSGQTVTLRDPDGQKIILLGVGKVEELDEKAVRKLAAPLYKTLTAEGVKEVVIDTPSVTNSSNNNSLAANLADALQTGTYEFKKYKTSGDKDAPVKLEGIEILARDPKQAAKIYEPLCKVTESVFWASDIANEPGNVINPKTYANKLAAELPSMGIKVHVLEKEDMERLGMGAALAVGQGSATPPRMVVMEYDGTGGKQPQPLAIVGKALTFDSGGISLKPGQGMDEMTMDKAGSIAVVGTMRALAAREAKVHVVAIVGMAENMPDANAQRPGDIVKAMNGKTIFVGNTDAEGRLVLADALTYIQRTYNPHTVVNLATLTGAALGATGVHIAPFYANDPDKDDEKPMRDKFNRASKATGEMLWPMPLMETPEFTAAVKKTPFADLSNIAPSSKAGSCTAAAFLHEFIDKDEKGVDKCNFVHIDMAGPGCDTENVRKGWGVRLLNQLVINNYEEKPARKIREHKLETAKM